MQIADGRWNGKSVVIFARIAGWNPGSSKYRLIDVTRDTQLAPLFTSNVADGW